MFAGGAARVAGHGPTGARRDEGQPPGKGCRLPDKEDAQGDRTEYIRKLGELEGRMQMFHDSITEKLGLEGAVEGEPDLVENVLAPYKDPPGDSPVFFSNKK